MTDKQVKTILLYAQNYTAWVIAIKLKVSESTIRKRLKSMKLRYPREFENAQSIRDSHKRGHDSLRHLVTFTELLGTLETIQDIF